MSDNEKEQNGVEPDVEVNENVNSEKGDVVGGEEDNEEVRNNGIMEKNIHFYPKFLMAAKTLAMGTICLPVNKYDVYVDTIVIIKRRNKHYTVKGKVENPIKNLLKDAKSIYP